MRTSSKFGKEYRRRFIRMYKQERKEHPSFTPRQVRRIVLDHMNKQAHERAQA